MKSGRTYRRVYMSFTWKIIRRSMLEKKPLEGTGRHQEGEGRKYNRSPQNTTFADYHLSEEWDWEDGSEGWQLAAHHEDLSVTVTPALGDRQGSTEHYWPISFTTDKLSGSVRDAISRQ